MVPRRDHGRGDAGGGRVAHRAFTVARRGAWTVPLANRFFVGFADRLQHDPEEPARRMEAHLGTR